MCKTFGKEAAETEDNKLIRQIKNGDKAAFEQLVKKYYRNIFSYCYRRTGDEDTAADLTQDIFLKLIASIYNYRFSGKFINFIFTIAVNTCNDYFRKTRPTIEAETAEIPDSSDTPIEAVIRTEESRCLQSRLSMLPDNQREAIILYYYHDMKAKDIAKVTGVPLSTAKSRIKQGLDKLRKQYGRDG